MCTATEVRESAHVVLCVAILSFVVQVLVVGSLPIVPFMFSDVLPSGQLLAAASGNRSRQTEALPSLLAAW
ncbi:MAG: hypothetical protein WCF68_08715 [Terriglobales bacterium]